MTFLEKLNNNVVKNIDNNILKQVYPPGTPPMITSRAVATASMNLKLKVLISVITFKRKK